MNSDQELANNKVYVAGLDNPLLAIADIIHNEPYEQALRVACLVIKSKQDLETKLTEANHTIIAMRNLLACWLARHNSTTELADKSREQITAYDNSIPAKLKTTI